MPQFRRSEPRARRSADPGTDRVGNRVVADTGVGGQQDLRPLDFACRMFAATEQPRKLSALLVAQIDTISYVHR